jgi:hypothetical protein
VEEAGDQLILKWNGRILPLKAHRKDLYFYLDRDTGQTVSVGFVLEGESPGESLGDSPGDSAGDSAGDLLVQYIQINSSPCRRFRPDTSWTPAPGAWPDYAGRYTGVENMVVRLQADQLLVYSEDLDQEMVCMPLADHHFACDAGLLTFHVTPGGAVLSLKLGNVYTLRKADT